MCQTRKEISYIKKVEAGIYIGYSTTKKVYIDFPPQTNMIYKVDMSILQKINNGVMRKMNGSKFLILFYKR
jgi:hypothetical protein